MRRETHTREKSIPGRTESNFNVGILGLGYVGLPLAHAAVRGGYNVLGFDVDESKIRFLKSGESYVGRVPSSTLREMLAKSFDVTADFGRLNEPDAILLCVPT